MDPETFDPATLHAFTDGKPYLGEFDTGLYPEGKNEMPQAHRQAGERIAAAIRPLDVEGAVDEQNGRILGLVLGHSYCSMYFRALERHLAQRRGELHPRFELINAAVGGQQLPQIVAFSGGVWDRAQSLLDGRPGYSGRQVQVLFLHTTYHGAGNARRLPPGPFPETMRDMPLVHYHLIDDRRSLDVAEEYAQALGDTIASKPDWARQWVATMNNSWSRWCFQRIDDLAASFIGPDGKPLPEAWLGESVVYYAHNDGIRLFDSDLPVLDRVVTVPAGAPAGVEVTTESPATVETGESRPRRPPRGTSPRGRQP